MFLPIKISGVRFNGTKYEPVSNWFISLLNATTLTPEKLLFDYVANTQEQYGFQEINQTQIFVVGSHTSETITLNETNMKTPLAQLSTAVCDDAYICVWVLYSNEAVTQALSESL